MDSFIKKSLFHGTNFAQDAATQLSEAEVKLTTGPSEKSAIIFDA